MTTLIHTAPTMLLAACATVLALFIGFYMALSRWTSTSVGRIVMGLCISLEAILLIGFSRSMFGQWPGIDVVRCIVYAAMLAGLIHLLVTLRHIQRTNPDGSLDPPLAALAVDTLRRRKPRRKDTP